MTEPAICRVRAAAVQEIEMSTKLKMAYIDDHLRQSFTAERLQERRRRRAGEALLADIDAELIADAERLAGEDAAAVAIEVESLERALRRLREDDDDVYMRRRVGATRIRLHAFVARRRQGIAVTMADLWRGPATGERQLAAWRAA